MRYSKLWWLEKSSSSVFKQNTWTMSTAKKIHARYKFIKVLFSSSANDWRVPLPGSNKAWCAVPWCLVCVYVWCAQRKVYKSIIYSYSYSYQSCKTPTWSRSRLWRSAFDKRHVWGIPFFWSSCCKSTSMVCQRFFAHEAYCWWTKSCTTWDD